MPKLQVLLPDGVATQYELSDEPLTIGRGSNNTIKIDDQKASRNHCTITKESDGDYHVKDLDSRNGTKLNGVKIGTRTKLKVGDVIRIGKTKFAFEKFPDNWSDDDDLKTGVGTVEDTVEEKPKYVLEITEGKSIGGIIDLTEGVTTFGRKPSNDVIVDDDKASGNHCEVRKEAMGYILVDLESTNGTRFRAAGKSEFEKIAKVPLSVGGEIRIGATVYKYKNVGAPNPDDEVLAEIAGGKPAGAEKAPAAAGGAVSGAPAHTGKTVHHPRPVASPLSMAMLGVVVAVAVLAVGFAIYNSQKANEDGGDQTGGGDVPTPHLEPRTMAIKNANFQLATNADGLPQYWAVGEHGRQKLTALSDPKDGVASKNMVAAVDRSPAGGEHSLFELASEHFDVEQGEAYGVSLRLRSSIDAEGAFGAKLQFFSTKNELVAEYPFLLTGSHDAWYPIQEKDFVVKAPGQKSYAQVVLLAVGNKGTVFFDDVRVRQLPGENPPRPPKEVAAGPVQFKPRDFTGSFAVAVNNQPALQNAHLVIIDKKGNVVAGSEAISLSDLRESKPQAKIYNPMLNEWVNFEIKAASAGPRSVLVTITPKDKPSDPGYHLALMADLGATLAGSRIEAIDNNGGSSLLAAADQGFQRKSTPELVFTQADTSLSVATTQPNQLTVSVGHLADQKRPVAIYCDGATELVIGPDSQTLARVSAEVVEQIDTAVRDRRWGEAIQKLADFQTRFAARFPALETRTTGLKTKIDAAFTTDFSTAGKTLPPGTGPVSQEVANGVLPTLNRFRDTWKGTEHEGDFTALIQQINDRVKSQADSVEEDAAAKMADKEKIVLATLEEAKKDDVVNKLTAQLVDYQAVIGRYSTTKAAAVATPKLEAWAKDLERLTNENELLDAVQNLVTAGEYAKARDFVQAHPKYKLYNHPGSMPRLEERIKHWAANQP